MQKIICIIPARLESTRFPRKVLAHLRGKPLLQWVYEAAMRCEKIDEIYFAVDAHVTLELIKSFGAKGFLTNIQCQNGTERMIELLEKIDGDIWINWQADEPFIDERMISTLLSTCDDDSDVWTLKKRIDHLQEAQNPHAVKVVTDVLGRALYFSRLPIPYRGQLYKHLGIYAFSKKSLYKIKNLQPCEWETCEKLEQLRFIYHGLKIRVHEVDRETVGIDTPEDLVLAENCINRV